MLHRSCLALGLVLALSGSPAHADATISDFSWMDRNHMAKQIKRIDDIARIRVGAQIRENATDLETLQRIINEELIDTEDPLALQALGAVLGNVMAAEVDHLEWKVYEDELGRSRALCVRRTEECLFPITMLSRRMETGLRPNVRRVYDNALDIIAPFLPEMPYGGASSEPDDR